MYKRDRKGMFEFPQACDWKTFGIYTLVVDPGTDELC